MEFDQTKRKAAIAVGASLAAFLLVGGVTAAAVTHKDNKPQKTTLVARQTNTTAAPNNAASLNYQGVVETNAPTPVVMAKAADVPTTTPRPKVLVASSSLNRIVTINTTTGKTENVLFTKKNDSCAGIGNVSLTPDSKTVYFYVAEQKNTHVVNGFEEYDCLTNVYSIPVTGGAVKFVHEGTNPRVSPDGKKLAVFVEGVHSVEETPGSLEIIELATGKVTKISAGNDCCNANFNWAPDSQHMVFQGEFCGCGGTMFMDLNIIDTATKQSRKVNLPRTIAKNSAWTGATYMPDGNLFLFETSNEAITATDEDKKRPTPRMLIVDPNTSKTIKVLTTGFPERTYDTTDSDASGHHLSYLSHLPSNDGSDLMVSDYLARPTKLASGITSMDWN